MNDTQNEVDVFLAAIEIDALEARAAYLDAACGDDDQLRQRVEALLRRHLESEGVLDTPPAGVDATVERPLSEGPGTIIGPYKLLQQIGEGGMGVVFMAEQTEPLQRTVALKIIKPGMDTRQVIARFEAERQALAMMDHPNIAKVLDAGTTGEGVGFQVSGVREGNAASPLTPDTRHLTPNLGRPYFVMDLVKGVPITDYCDQQHLPVNERLELIAAVCQAVQHAHQKGIIHRDIKPTNVLVAEYDGKPVPKVIDFGVAKATAQRLTEKTMFTEFGQVLGTMEYMSPEQAKLNQLDIDTRSDIYSLGVLLYELLTGSTPIARKRLNEAAFDEMLRIIREEEPPKPSTRLTTSDMLPSIAANRHSEPDKLTALVRGELDWIVMKCLEKNRNRRYETASGFATDLQRYLDDEPVQACPPSAAYRFRKFALRNKAALATTIIVAFSLVSGTAVSTWQAVRATRATHEAEAAAVREAKLRHEAEAGAKIAQAQNLCNEAEFEYAEQLMSEVPPVYIELEATAAARILHTLAILNAGEQRWAQAADHYKSILFGPAKAGLDVDIGPLTMTHMEYSPLPVMLGDTAAYERFRESVLARWAESKTGTVVERMLLACLLLPANDAQTIVLNRWAADCERTVESAGDLRCWPYAALALFAYRTNKFDQALEWGRKCLDSAPPPACQERANIIMAMAYARLNRPGDAEAELARCRKQIEDKFSGRLARGDYATGSWEGWLIDRVLLREADGLLESRPTAEKMMVGETPI